MIGLAEASERILARLGSVGTERVPLAAALGRVLASEVVSTVSLPPWPNSAMDGYAVRARDVEGATVSAPVRLMVTEEIAAGHFPLRPIRQGEAARIMTGAPIPEGADSVVRVEDTDDGREAVEVRSGRDAGRNVRPSGEDVRAGAVAVSSHIVVRPPVIAMLAAVGCADVQVFRKPRVAILGSGDELVTVDRFAEVERGTRIVATNGYGLAAIIREAGGEPIDLGIAPDNAELIAGRLRGAQDVDLIVTTGGISVGAHDHIRAIVTTSGAVDFWKVQMRPGAQTAAGHIAGIPWIGLPGNPVSALVTGEMFVRPAVLRMSGLAAVHRVPVRVTLAERVGTAGGATHLLRATVQRDGEGLVARLTGPQGTGLLSSMAAADVLLIVPPDVTTVESGQSLSALPLWPAERSMHLSLEAGR